MISHNSAIPKRRADRRTSKYVSAQISAIMKNPYQYHPMWSP